MLTRRTVALAAAGASAMLTVSVTVDALGKMRPLGGDDDDEGDDWGNDEEASSSNPKPVRTKQHAEDEDGDEDGEYSGEEQQQGGGNNHIDINDPSAVDRFASQMDKKLGMEDDDDKDGNQADRAEFFAQYEHPEMHRQMIMDTARTDAYKLAIENVPGGLKGKTVVDFGCGSGVLSLFALKAGAEKVWCVEKSGIVATDSSGAGRAAASASASSSVSSTSAACSAEAAQLPPTASSRMAADREICRIIGPVRTRYGRMAVRQSNLCAGAAHRQIHE